MGNAVLNYFDPRKRPNVLNILSTEQGDGKSTLAGHLAAYLRETGMKVRIASWNKDFDSHQKDFLLASRLEEFVHDTEGETPLAEADVVIVEYPPLDDSAHLERGCCKTPLLNIMVAPGQPHQEGDRPTAL